MASANSPTEKRNVLNAILYTKNMLILRRYESWVRRM
jgi:predicted NAD/FAD-binding protein